VLSPFWHVALQSSAARTRSRLRTRTTFWSMSVCWGTLYLGWAGVQTIWKNGWKVSLHHARSWMYQGFLVETGFSIWNWTLKSWAFSLGIIFWAAWLPCHSLCPALVKVCGRRNLEGRPIIAPRPTCWNFWSKTKSLAVSWFQLLSIEGTFRHFLISKLISCNMI